MSIDGWPLTTEPKTVGILIYPDVEVLDFGGPFEVFATTRLDEETRRESESPIQQLLVSESNELVRASGGMKILPDVDFSTCPRLDMLLVPGWTRKSRADASAGMSGMVTEDGAAG